MDKVILIKYGELSTKSGNRGFFINTLYKNIKYKLRDYDVKIHKDRARIYIEFLEEDLDNIKNIIDKIFGIYKYHIASVVDSLDNSIQSKILEIIKEEEFNTFKVEVKRSNKNFPIRSMDYVKVLGGLILKNSVGKKVDVHNPDIVIKVEIRDNETFIYTNQYLGSGGYPVGTQQKGLLMLSGGIDSPVSLYLALKRGVEVDCVYFEAIPHTSIEARNKVISLCKKLVKYTDRINLHIVNFTPIQEEIYKNAREDYCITIMRRMMYRIMDKLCNKYKAKVIINGESIGQVASQTLTSMNVINSVTNIPVIRPLACFDKLEIIDISKKIDTYNISIIPYEDCCTVFVPSHPVINPKVDICIKEEEKFDYNLMIEESIDTINTIVIEDKENDEYSSYL